MKKLKTKVSLVLGVAILATSIFVTPTFACENELVKPQPGGYMRANKESSGLDHETWKDFVHAFPIRAAAEKRQKEANDELELETPVIEEPIIEEPVIEEPDSEPDEELDVPKEKPKDEIEQEKEIIKEPAQDIEKLEEENSNEDNSPQIEESPDEYHQKENEEQIEPVDNEKEGRVIIATGGTGVDTVKRHYAHVDCPGHADFLNEDNANKNNKVNTWKAQATHAAVKNAILYKGITAAPYLPWYTSDRSLIADTHEAPQKTSIPAKYKTVGIIANATANPTIKMPGLEKFGPYTVIAHNNDTTTKHAIDIPKLEKFGPCAFGINDNNTTKYQRIPPLIALHGSAKFNTKTVFVDQHNLEHSSLTRTKVFAEANNKERTIKPPAHSIFQEIEDRDVATAFQTFVLYPHMTVYDNMAFGLKLRKMPKDEIDKRVKEAAEILDKSELRQRSTMGYGEQMFVKGFNVPENIPNYEFRFYKPKTWNAPSEPEQTVNRTAYGAAVTIFQKLDNVYSYGRLPAFTDIPRFIENVPTVNETKIPYIPWHETLEDSTNGFRTSHEIQKIAHWDYETLKDMSPMIGKIVYGTMVDEQLVKPARLSTVFADSRSIVPNKIIYIQSGIMTTVHAYADFRLISTELQANNATGAAKAIGLIIPELNRKNISLMKRVPTPMGINTASVAASKEKSIVIVADNGSRNAFLIPAINESIIIKLGLVALPSRGKELDIRLKDNIQEQIVFGGRWVVASANAAKFIRPMRAMPGANSLPKEESLESALRRFKRSTARGGIIPEARKREHYEKPSAKRKKKADAARKRKY